MSETRIGIIGHFAQSRNLTDGQTVKTNMLYLELCRYFSSDSIFLVDTYNWKNRRLRLLFDTFCIISKCPYIIILVKKNGMRVFFPLLILLNMFFRRDIHHVVVGGDLPELIKQNKSWKYYLKAFAANHVETLQMQKELNVMGINNIVVMPNFKRLPILDESELNYNYSKPFALCTFSRVMQAKGIGDAIAAVNSVNALIGETVYTLDIYGQVDEKFEDEFHELLTTDPVNIRYRGIVPFSASVSVLRNYFLLLFPTSYVGEGFPGTLLDAFSAGLPVIASDWRYNTELIEDKQEGYIVKTNDVQALTLKLIEIYYEPEQISEMKRKCLKKAWRFHPDIVVKEFLTHVGVL